MKALVTGGLGFIGSNLVDMLIDKGWDVIVIDNLSTGNLDYTNTKAHYCIKDLNDITIEDMGSCDYIFHTAALPRIQPSFEDPLAHDFANVTVTLKLIQCAKQNKNLKKIIYSSSSSAYGTPKNTPTTETEQIDPLSPYALQKYASERYIHILCERYEIPFITLRYFNVYGNRSFSKKNIQSAYTSVIGIFQNQKNEGLELTITGDGQQKRDFINVLDVANANYMAAISNVSGECFNVGYGECYTILQIAQMFNHQYVFIPKRNGEAIITHADITKIQEMLNWKPILDLKKYIK